MMGSPSKPHRAVTFRVYPRYNGECKHEFQLKHKDITWKNLLRNLFGESNIEEGHLPSIYYFEFDENGKTAQQCTPVKSLTIQLLARTALLKAYKGDCINIMIPEYDSFPIHTEKGANVNEIKSLLRNSEINVDPNTGSVRRKELQVTDLTKIFASEIEASLKSSMQNKLNMNVHNSFENIIRIEKPLDREDLPQEEGKLRVRRLSNSTMIDLLKEGTSLILPTENNKFLLVNFVKDPFPVLNGMKLNWQRRDIRNYECEELKIPVSIGKELNYIFARDAEFVKNFAYHLSCAEQYAKQQSDHEKKKIKTKKCKESVSNLDKRFSKLTLATFPDAGETETASSNVVVEATSPRKVEQIMPENFEANPPRWFGEYLDKFKLQILEDVQNTVKSLLTPTQIAHSDMPSTSNTFLLSDKNTREEVLDDDRNSKGYEMWLSGKRAVDGSSKKKPFPLSNKRDNNKMEKMVEIGYGLFVISKAGFKLRMPRNASLNLRLILVKYGKYRTSKEEPELRVQYVSEGIECCIKSAAKSVDKLSPKEKYMYSYYDVRIKTKDKSGKFRLCFNVVHHGKVRGHSFKMDVRVRKVYSLSTAPDLIDLSSEEPSRYNADFDGSVLAAVPSTHTFDGKSSNQEGILLSGELADEGIGGNQEDFYSPTSDSDDSDAEEPNFSDSKPDLHKDEGIDTCYHSTNFSEAGPVPEESGNDTESDTDSSISFLMDENEARDELNEALDVINLPSCFIPNANLDDDTHPVRIKRKRSDKKRGSESDSLADQIVNARIEQSFKQENLSSTSGDESLKLDAKEEADHAYYRSIYPNLKGLKEFVNPIADKKVENGIPSNDNPAEASTSGTKFEPVNILPEKVFETVSNVWKTVYNTKKSLSENEHFPKQVQETVSSVFNAVSSEINANAVRAASVAASAADMAAAEVKNAVSTFASATNPSTDNASANPTPAEQPSQEQSSKSENNGTVHIDSMYQQLAENIRENLIILNEMGFMDDPYNIYLLNRFPNNLDKVIESLVNYASV